MRFNRNFCFPVKKTLTYNKQESRSIVYEIFSRIANEKDVCPLSKSGNKNNISCKTLQTKGVWICFFRITTCILTEVETLCRIKNEQGGCMKSVYSAPKTIHASSIWMERIRKNYGRNPHCFLNISFICTKTFYGYMTKKNLNCVQSMIQFPCQGVIKSNLSRATSEYLFIRSKL